MKKTLGTMIAELRKQQGMTQLELAPKAVAMAMGIAVTVLTVLNALDTRSGMIMLGIGLACVGISLMSDKK